MPQSISGLGIDMGPPAMSASASRKRSQTAGSSHSEELPASLNQYNHLRRQSLLPTRRPTTSSTMSDRKVRIASGEPGVLGKGSPDGNESDASSTTSGQSASKRYTSGPMNRNHRLSVAVANMTDRGWESSATPSDVYSSDASPETESSATSFSSGAQSGTSSLKRNMTVKKQRSQPNLSRASTLVRTETISNPSASTLQRPMGPPKAANAAGMIRSKSTMSLSSQYKDSSASESSTTSLGRSNEIPRSGSRASTAQRGRGRGSVRGGRARSATWDPRSAAGEALETTGGLIPDGFGGYVEPERAAYQAKPPTEIDYSGSPPTEVQQQQAPPRRLPSAPQQLQTNRPAQSTQSSVRELPSRPGIAALKVGSFYAPDGSETARLDDDGRLSKIGTNRSTSSIGHSSSSQSGEMQSTTSSQRSRSSSRPRPLFMSSPGSKQNDGSSSEGGHEVVQDRGAKLQKSKSQVSMRSERGWKGLDGAERGQAMISLDALNDTFQQGESIEPGRIKQADQDSILASARPTPNQNHQNGYASDGGFVRHNSNMPPMMARSVTDSQVTSRSNASQLDRQNTLISASSNPARRSKELNRLLASNNGRKLTSSASSSAGDSIASASTDSLSSTRSLSRSNAIGQSTMPPAVLEQGKSGKSRVDVDLVLESDLVVEGGILAGRLEIKVRKSSDKDGPLMLTQPKVRVVGFEELLNDDTRHIFYHHATVINGSPKIGSGPFQPYVLHGTPSLSPEADNRKPLDCFASSPDAEGYCVAKDGSHSVPFALELPVGKGAKGSYRGKHAIVRYIVIGSVKLKSANGSNRSIAHFYRHVELYPYLNPAVILSSSSKPVQARASKGLFLGGSGKVHLAASLHRSTWVAGQRVYVNISIDNETNKKVKSLTLALVRTVTLYRPRPEFDMQMSAPDDPSEAYIDPDACSTSTSRKKITEEVLEMGQKGSKGLVTARGWWTGVEGGESVEFSHNMKLPVDALTISRGRHVEVLYSIKVSISSSLSSDVSVELPLRVVNFVSLDPPPLKTSSTKVTRNWARENHQRNAMSESEAPIVDRMRVMEALRSPGRFNTGLGLEPANYSQGYPPDPTLQAQQPGSREVLSQSIGSGGENNGNQLQVPGVDVAKRLQHQKSLDFINHAIRSATARKTRSNEPSPAGLGIELDNDRTPPTDYSSASSSSGASMVSSAAGPIHPSCAPYEHRPQQQVPDQTTAPYRYGHYQHPVNLPLQAVSLDDVGDDSDEDLGVGNQTLNLNDESVMEVDYVIGSARMDGGESSPAFQQRREFGIEEAAVYEDDLSGEGEEEGDTSTSTVTGRPGMREEDEYDEEEERLERQREAEQELMRRGTMPNLDDESTPLAHSPPKFQQNAAPSSSVNVNRLAMLPKTKPSVPRLRAAREESGDEYLSSSSTSSRRSVVRTKSDLESRLGRSSTIIRGPVGDVSRPVSPSKQAPSPKKSALKSKSSFTFATSDRPLKAAGPRSSTTNTKNIQQSKPGMIPLTLKAKVDARQIPKAVAPRGVTAKRSTSATQQRPNSVPAKKQSMVKSSKISDAESESNASTSPASSVSVLTPELAQRDLMDTNHGQIPIEEDDGSDVSMLGLGMKGMKLNLVDATPEKIPVKEVRLESMAVPLESDNSNNNKTTISASESAPSSLTRSTSTHNLRGSSVVVPSVRDKIAMLENRKQALKEFTGSASMIPSPSTSNAGTPTRSNGSVRSNSNNNTPTRVQAATRQLERNNSMISDVSSQADYLKHTPSFASFKAPLLNPSTAPTS